MISIYVLKIIEHITEIRRKAPVAFDEKRNSFALLELLINACDVCITNIKLIRGLVWHSKRGLRARSKRLSKMMEHFTDYMLMESLLAILTSYKY